MVAKRSTKTSTGKKLKLKRETLKDLGGKNARRVKGGALIRPPSSPCVPIKDATY